MAQMFETFVGVISNVTACFDFNCQESGEVEIYQVRPCSPHRLFKSLNRTVTCTRGLISIYMCYSQGDGLTTSLSRLSYLVLYTVVQSSTYTLSLYGTKYPMYWTLMMNDI